MDRVQERELIDGLIRDVVEQCPRRFPTSESEARAQQIVRSHLEAAGVTTRLHTFLFNASAPANVALHFGLATLGTIVGGLAPRLAFALHAGSTVSYYAESTRRAYLLRRILPHRPCQNLLGVLPAQEEPSLRIVFVAHVDAAFTGMAYDSRVVRAFSRKLPRGLGFLGRPMAFATRAQAALAGIDLIRSVVGPLAWPLRPIELALTLPSALIFFSSLEIVLRDEVVPGANDNLTGVAALPVLAHRLAQDKPADVEIAFVSTAAEEASMGGADALARDMEAEWDKARTVVVVLDTLCSGNLCFLDPEGEVVRLPVPSWLRESVLAVAASDPRFSEVQAFEPPLGGTDAAPFLAHGWDAIALTCIDRDLGSARHYHQPSDTPDNVDLDKVLTSVDFAEALARRIMSERGRTRTTPSDGV